ncbi:MAG: hypothetical protein A2138_26875 [Deltaproteobacteria bacterium RBG_16_71_12]|nr:MAG: hypothetical protein A2138_26875 [Deltaproteobacteria bacterium RBG_16_71_12]
MTTLITAGNNTSTRRCDGTCHNAKQPACVCVCAGRFHGKGFQEAQYELTEQWRPWLEEMGYVVPESGQQLGLLEPRCTHDIFPNG